VFDTAQEYTEKQMRTGRVPILGVELLLFPQPGNKREPKGRKPISDRAVSRIASRRSSADMRANEDKRFSVILYICTYKRNLSRGLTLLLSSLPRLPTSSTMLIALRSLESIRRRPNFAPGRSTHLKKRYTLTAILKHPPLRSNTLLLKKVIQ
jgi:hypothetical protein